jgi:hypothetical protein
MPLAGSFQQSRASGSGVGVDDLLQRLSLAVRNIQAQYMIEHGVQQSDKMTRLDHQAQTEGDPRPQMPRWRFYWLDIRMEENLWRRLSTLTRGPQKRKGQKNKEPRGQSPRYGVLAERIHCYRCRKKYLVSRLCYILIANRYCFLFPCFLQSLWKQ